ncbi:hypothetical protein DFJ75_2777 [Williamsia muralis]|uniref:Uncharacterized protein n=1 Tax=Williamsia marianensis TaxID=85044 RepID=A0A495K5V6_WILMA|nr:hypothetical protein DFJ75_2777 [Williamsia muralis]
MVQSDHWSIVTSSSWFEEAKFVQVASQNYNRAHLDGSDPERDENDELNED